MMAIPTAHGSMAGKPTPALSSASTSAGAASVASAASSASAATTSTSSSKCSGRTLSGYIYLEWMFLQSDLVIYSWDFYIIILITWAQQKFSTAANQECNSTFVELVSRSHIRAR